MKQAAGILLYEKTNEGLKVLIVHPSGSYNAHAPWSIPKGEVDKGEHPIDTAVRELLEEVGVGISETQLVYIGSCEYKSRTKEVLCYIGQVEGQPGKVNSWEIDEARWVTLDEARTLLREEMRIFIDQIEQVLI